MKRFQLFLSLIVLTVTVAILTFPSPLKAQIKLDVQSFISSSGVALGVVLFQDGTQAAPGIAYASEPALGFRRTGAQTIYLGDNSSAVQIGIGTVGNTAGLILNGGGSPSGLILASTSAIGWTNGTEVNSRDIVLRHSAAKTLTVDTDGAGGALTLVDIKSVTNAPFISSPASSVLTINTNVITPTGSVHHVGAGLIKTITVPSGMITGSVDIVPDAAFTTDVTGNISLASTAVISRTLRFTWDGTKWNPSY